jgi:hypothetical protein
MRNTRFERMMPAGSTSATKLPKSPKDLASAQQRAGMKLVEKQ